jgi:hypothetical protein
VSAECGWKACSGWLGGMLCQRIDLVVLYRSSTGHLVYGRRSMVVTGPFGGLSIRVLI